MNKFHAVRTYSNLCEREFSSRAESKRGEELFLLQKAGVISRLQYQPRFILSNDPRVTYSADFKFNDENNIMRVEDVKGKMTEATRVRIAWLKQLTGIEVILVRR